MIVNATYFASTLKDSATAARYFVCFAALNVAVVSPFKVSSNDTTPYAAEVGLGVGLVVGAAVGDVVGAAVVGVGVGAGVGDTVG